MQSEGDIKDSIRKIYCNHYTSLIRYGCCIENDVGLVHDEIQELFVWLLRNPGKILELKDPVTYLFLSLRRNIRAAMQKKKIARHNGKSFAAGRENEEPCQEARIIEDETQTHRKTLLIKKLDELPPRQKEVIYLRFFETLSYNDIAEILGVNNQVVRNIVYRSIQNLRQKYAQIEVF